MLLSALAAVPLVLSVTTLRAQPETAVQFDLPSQPLAESIRAVARETDTNVMFDSSVVAGKQAPALKTRGTAEEALQVLLRGTGLTYQRYGEHSIRVATQSEVDSDNQSKHVGARRVEENSALRLAQANNPRPAAASPAALTSTAADGEQASEGGPTPLQEVIVTAQKRAERLQDVPVPVTALEADSLRESNQLRLQDYYSNVPGLSFTTNVGGAANLSIRGITTGNGTNPTVGITIDGVPYGSSSALANAGINVPDIDPSDLQRIEVLRGPQGTLYGASSIGGLLQYVTLEPSTQALSGRIEAGIDSVHNGAELGYTFRGAINVPLSDTLAVRASAFTRRDAGYVDNPTLGLDGVNKANVQGGHVAALWRPTDILSVKLTALLQDSTGSGNSYANVQPGSGTLQQSFIPGAGAYQLSARLYTATVKASLPGFDITSISGYGANRVLQLLDASSYNGFFTDGLFGIPTSAGRGAYRTNKFTEELRFSSNTNQRIEWLIAGFYTHEVSPTDQEFTAAPDVVNTPATLAGPLFADYNFPSKFAEYALFADLTAHFTDHFDVQFGGRESTNHQIYNETDSGPAIPTFFDGYPSPLVAPTIHTHDSAFTYLVTPRYKFSEDLMLYARLASGYRPGGPNPDATVFGFPARYGADKTLNYEIGLKGDAFDRMLSFDASVYYIDWKDIQLSVSDPTSGFVFYTNAGRAHSKGVELSAQLRPYRGLTLAGWISLNDATLTEDFPSTAGSVGLAGDRLPYSSRFSANLSLEQELPLTADLSAFGGASVNYIGQRYGDFLSVYATTSRVVYPGYAQTNLHAGVRENSWTVNFYLNNATDRRGVTFIDPSLGQGYIYIQPRTVGVSVSKIL